MLIAPPAPIQAVWPLAIHAQPPITLILMPVRLALPIATPALPPLAALLAHPATTTMEVLVLLAQTLQALLHAQMPLLP